MLKKNIATNELGYVFNPATGDSFNTNPIAASIIHYMRDGKSISNIKKLILESYEVEPDMVEKDLDDFLQSLKDFNLLTPVV